MSRILEFLFGVCFDLRPIGELIEAYGEAPIRRRIAEIYA
jgi:hypothetical protein